MRMNPVYKNELKMMARSAQLPVLAVIFNTVLGLVAVIAVYCMERLSYVTGTAPYIYMMPLYMGMLTVEVCMLCLFVPSAAGGSIAGERERQTMDILLASKMTVKGIIIGKLLSCISMAIMLGVSSLPVLCMSLMYGGIGLMDVYSSVAYVGFLVLLIGCVGVFCSCRFTKTTFASVAAYGIIIFLTVGTGVIVALLNMAWQLSTNRGYLAEGAAGFGGLVYVWLLNPAVTYVMILFGQLGDMEAIESVLVSFGALPEIVDHWIALSILAQSVLIVILLVFAAWYLDPQNERFRPGTKILKKHKSK